MGIAIIRRYRWDVGFVLGATPAGRARAQASNWEGRPSSKAGEHTWAVYDAAMCDTGQLRSAKRCPTMQRVLQPIERRTMVGVSGEERGFPHRYGVAPNLPATYARGLDAALGNSRASNHGGDRRHHGPVRSTLGLIDCLACTAAAVAGRGNDDYAHDVLSFERCV